MLVIENCNSLSDLRQKLIDGEEVRTVRQEPCEDWYDVPSDEMTLEQARQAVKDLRKKLAEHLEQEPKWIPVSEELPDKEGHYLCSVRYMYPPYNFFEPEKVKYMDDVTIQKFDGEFNIEVKAWMPLPPCYDPQERNEK